MVLQFEDYNSVLLVVWCSAGAAAWTVRFLSLELPLNCLYKQPAYPIGPKTVDPFALVLA